MTRIPDYLREAASSVPLQPAVILTGGSEIGYGELDRTSTELAGLLRSCEVGPGDRVAIVMRKSIEALVSIHAVLKSGAAYVPLDPGAPVARNAEFLRQCGAVVALVTEVSTGEEVPDTCVGTYGVGAVSIHLHRLQGSPLARRAPAPDDPAVLLRTSGTSGKSKAVVLTHANLIAGIEWYSEVLRPAKTDRIGSQVSLVFAASLFDLFLPVKHGLPLILIAEQASRAPEWVLDALRGHQVTMFKAPASVLGLVAAFARNASPLPSVRYLISGGGIFPVDRLGELRRLFPSARILNSYGSTEALTIMFYAVDGDATEGHERIASGKEQFAAEVRIVDEQGQEVVGSPGELWLSGPTVMRGYWDGSGFDSRSFVTDSSGRRWYRTGDMALKAVTGGISILGRKDRLVKRRGYRIALEEIESSLAAHPGIREVAVIARPDEVSGCKIEAYYSTRQEPGPKTLELRGFLAAALPPQMIPDAMEQLDQLPRTPTGKIDLKQLERRRRS